MISSSCGIRCPVAALNVCEELLKHVYCVYGVCMCLLQVYYPEPDPAQRKQQILGNSGVLLYTLLFCLNFHFFIAPYFCQLKQSTTVTGSICAAVTLLMHDVSTHFVSSQSLPYYGMVCALAFISLVLLLILHVSDPGALFVWFVGWAIFFFGLGVCYAHFN